MRCVPSRILVGIAAAAALLAGSVVVHAGQGDDLRDRADQLESGLQDVAENEDAVVLELFALESDFARATERVAELERQAARVGDATDLAREQTQVARRALSTAEKNLAERLRALYTEDDVDSLDVFLGARSIRDAVDGFGALERAASYDERLIRQVSGARESAIERRDELRQRQRRVDQLVTNARTARQNLAQARTERAAFLQSLRADLALGRREVRSLRQRAVAVEARAAELRARARAEAEAQQTRDTGPPDSSPSADPAPAPPPTAAPPPAPSPSPSPSPPASPPTPSPSPSPPPAPADGFAAGSQLTVVATAYALAGTTAVGVQTQPGIVAVDPNVIPLGSKMFIPGYGEGVAADTGSAVKGAIIDVWLPTVEEALQWGRRTVTITFR